MGWPIYSGVSSTLKLKLNKINYKLQKCAHVKL